MLVDIGAHLFAAAGRLTYEEGRPVRGAFRISPDVLTSVLWAVSDPGACGVGPRATEVDAYH